MSVKTTADDPHRMTDAEMTELANEDLIYGMNRTHIGIAAVSDDLARARAAVGSDNTWPISHDLVETLRDVAHFANEVRPLSKALNDVVGQIAAFGHGMMTGAEKPDATGQSDYVDAIETAIEKLMKHADVAYPLPPL